MGEYKNKTVLVTGATGLIGSHIVDELMAIGGVRVIALGRSEEKLKTGFKEYLGVQHFQFVEHDIIEPLILETAIDYIFHAAGPMEGKIITNYPMSVINPNVIGTINCLEFLKKQKIEKNRSGRMILFSSITVYGNTTEQDIILTENDTKVTDALDTYSAPYSQSKRISEVITLAYCRQFGLDAVIGRFSTVYGPTRFIPDTAFFDFIRQGLAGENIILNCTGLPQRDNIYIDDAVKGVLLVGSDGAIGEAYNISSNGNMGNYASVDEIAAEIARVVNAKYSSHFVEVIFKEENPTERKPGIRLDNTKLKDLGWEISVSLAQGIKKTINDFLQR